ncbi:somatostatin receptor type 5-like [Eucyclogobius newberryi]|uniref:somatostatin receptor type 5-like n=1 Tax=Eucyclogobius newberryi TaxID=166745 RepID=UPI003B5C836C
MEDNNWTLTGDDAGISPAPTDYIGIHNRNSSQVPQMPVSTTALVTAVIFIIVFVVGLLGNTLVIYVVFRYTKMKTVTNLYILNLALADELYILGIPFLCTQNVLSYWPYGEFLCKIYMTADIMSQFTSTFCLTVMSIDRYLAVVHPLKSVKWRKPQVAKIINALLWVVSFLIALPVTIFSNIQDEFNTCNITWPDPNNLWSNVFILVTAILGFFGPVVVICLCYLLLVIRVRSAGARAGLTRRRRSERKVTRMVVIIVMVFVLCWLPFFTTNIVNLVYTIPESSVNVAIYFSLVILTYVNSCFNPILYGFLSENFKQSFQKVLCVNKPMEILTIDQQALTPNLSRTMTSQVPGSQRGQAKNGGMGN